MHRGGDLLPTTEYPYLHYGRGRTGISVGDGVLFRSGFAADSVFARTLVPRNSPAQDFGYRRAVLVLLGRDGRVFVRSLGQILVLAGVASFWFVIVGRRTWTDFAYLGLWPRPCC